MAQLLLVMAHGETLPSILSHAIRDGTFPDSDDVLSATLSTDAVASLLQDISNTKKELDVAVQQISKSLASGVDDWIAQAKRVQEDIAKCTADSRKIAEENETLETQRHEAREAANKVQLLEQEIGFTARLQRELHSIENITQRLREGPQSIERPDRRVAANVLAETRLAISNVTAPRVHALLSEHAEDLNKTLRAKLQNEFNGAVEIRLSSDTCHLAMREGLDIDKLSHALRMLEVDDNFSEAVITKLERFVSHALRRRGGRGLATYTADSNSITASRGSSLVSDKEAIGFVKDLVTVLSTNLGSIAPDIINKLMTHVVEILTTDCLNPAIPIDVANLRMLDELQADVAGLAQFLQQHNCQGSHELQQWIEAAPRMWLTKRKAETLDSIRQSYKRSKGMMQQVERVERQTASAIKQSTPAGPGNDDWNESWDEEQQDAHTDPETEQAIEDASGWGFDDEEEAESNDVEDGENEWGWGDEGEDQSKLKSPSSTPSKINGRNDSLAESQEVVLTEFYTVTDIPDHIVESLGKDISDAIVLRGEAPDSIGGVKAAIGLLSLPTAALAMFRATAPTHYTNTRNLGNMNLYNDSLYIADKLHNMSAPPGLDKVDVDCKTMERFARSAYSREMEIQRTILNDLLDGSQGFTSCTQFPYSQEIETAVSSTVDRLRDVHAEWKPILSTSALLQSIGALLASVILKVINDIEEMEDISEAQSQKLGSFCAQIATLEDLFLARSPEAQEGEGESVPMTAVYVASWLKFQYLMNILESSLVDIKYLWTEGELGLEFTPDEVVDLIKALFAETSHRRSAIAAIRA